MNLSERRRYVKQEISKLKYPQDSLFHYERVKIELYFLDIAKDAVDTFKPYKTPAHRKRDLLSIVEGIKHVLWGSLSLVPGLCHLFFGPIGVLLYSPLSMSFRGRLDKTLETAFAGLQNTLGSLAQIFRGITQIAATPLILMRIPFRTWLYGGVGNQSFRERKSIRALVEEGDTILAENEENSLDKITHIISESYRKQRGYLKKGLGTSLNPMSSEGRELFIKRYQPNNSFLRFYSYSDDYSDLPYTLLQRDSSRYLLCFFSSGRKDDTNRQVLPNEVDRIKIELDRLRV